MDRRFGGPLPRQLPNPTRTHLIPPEFFTPDHAVLCAYAVLAVISNCYPPVWGRLSTRYSPVRRSVILKSIRRLHPKCFARLACVKHAASVHPEPGSNSQIKVFHPVQNKLSSLSIPFTVFKGQFLKIKLFRIFQGCITVQLSRCFFFVFLSFLVDSFCSISCFLLLVNYFFKIFYFLFCSCLSLFVFISNFLNIPHVVLFVNHFFQIFQIFFCGQIWYSPDQAEKEGFEPSRRY